MFFSIIISSNELSCTRTHATRKQRLHYKECPFHRIVKGFVAQTGDIATGTGAGGESIWGKKFKDDLKGLKAKLDKRGY